MRKTFIVTVVTEIDFSGSSDERVVQDHLERLVERMEASARKLSTRVTKSVRVRLSGGGLASAPAKAARAWSIPKARGKAGAHNVE